VDDEKMDRILQIYDFLLSDEFATMRAYGLEGKDFKKEGDKIVITRPKNDQGNYVSLSELYPSLGNLFDTLAAWNQQFEFEDNEINRINYGEQLTKMSRDALKEALDNAKPIPTNYDILLMYTPAKAKLGAINPIDDVTKVMLSKEDPVAQWTNIVKGYDGKGLQEAIKEVNEKVQQEGLDKSS
jgi:putative aldouronate transport system substrate-binding protein